jgi:hypothetical protein
MRRKNTCKGHEGNIATCQKCKRVFSVNEIIATALNVHLGKPGMLFCFPETNVKFLDRHVYEQQKDFSWMSLSEHAKAIRYFASNALVNMHLVTHATRCFKKSSECFADLPDCENSSTQVIINNEFDIFSNWYGKKEIRSMFRFQPKRNIEDAFVNTHNPIITSLLGCNNNVLVGMNGRAVFYVTSYNVKSQQKEETDAYQKVTDILIKIMKKQVCALLFKEGSHQPMSVYNYSLIALFYIAGDCRGTIAYSTIRIPSIIGSNLLAYLCTHHCSSYGSLYGKKLITIYVFTRYLLCECACNRKFSQKHSNANEFSDSRSEASLLSLSDVLLLSTNPTGKVLLVSIF